MSEQDIEKEQIRRRKISIALKKTFQNGRKPTCFWKGKKVPIGVGNCKHGKRQERIYRIWTNIKARCSNKNRGNYKNYGGRGIQCLWKSFEEFYRDMGDPPSIKHSIDRVNNNYHYCKENCRWATRQEQNNNTRKSVFLTKDGVILNVTQWAKKLNKSPQTLFSRIRYGFTTNKILQ